MCLAQQFFFNIFIMEYYAFNSFNLLPHQYLSILHSTVSRTSETIAISFSLHVLRRKKIEWTFLM
jgi:hypothetical protein